MKIYRAIKDRSFSFFPRFFFFFYPKHQGIYIFVPSEWNISFYLLAFLKTSYTRRWKIIFKWKIICCVHAEGKNREALVLRNYFDNLVTFDLLLEGNRYLYLSLTKSCKFVGISTIWKRVTISTAESADLQETFNPYFRFLKTEIYALHFIYIWDFRWITLYIYKSSKLQIIRELGSIKI